MQRHPRAQSRDINFEIVVSKAAETGNWGQTGSSPYSKKSSIVTIKTNLVKQISENLPSVPNSPLAVTENF